MSAAKSRTLTITIDRPLAHVHDFLTDPPNLPLWAKRVCQSIRPLDGRGWVVQTPVGPVPIRFVSRPGEVDLLVSYWPGQEIQIPIRVTSIEKKVCEVAVTLVKPPLMPEEEFPQDVKLVELDLQTLKRVLESADAPTRDSDPY